MNLVIDDAVEVKLATKGEEESRTELGRSISPLSNFFVHDMLNDFLL